MRALVVLVAAMMLGLGGGYAWSALSAPHHKAHVPKVPKSEALVIPQSAEDRQWTERAEEADEADKPAAPAVHYAGCDEVRAARKAPLHADEPGYSEDMDGDGDGIACEPHKNG